MRVFVVGFVIIVNLYFTGCRSSAPMVAASPAAQSYARNCAACHKADGGGGVLNGAQVPSLKAERARRASDEYLKKQITHGGGGMPAFGNILSDAEIKLLIVHIRTEFQNKPLENKKPT